MIQLTISLNLTLLHSGRPKLYAILAFLSAIGLSKGYVGVRLEFDIGVTFRQTAKSRSGLGCKQMLKSILT